MASFSYEVNDLLKKGDVMPNPSSTVVAATPSGIRSRRRNSGRAGTTSPQAATIARLGIVAAVILAGVTVPGAATAQKTLIDYFLPTPIINSITTASWGASTNRTRDQDNGLEDKTNNYSYWDGRIVKAADGKYHLFCSRWDEAQGHWGGWPNSICVHTVSDSSPLGPYIDQGPCYGDAGGKGHNVMASQLNDGSYFILVSETRRPAVFYTSPSPNGPWTNAGTIQIDLNGYSTDGQASSNTSVWVEDNGDILGTARDGVIFRSTSGLTGPYKIQTRGTVYANIPFAPTGTPEDPCIWYSGCQYHMVYSYPLDRKMYHLTSPDGINNWTNMGLAVDATKALIIYTDGTTNIWNKLERPQVYLEDGHVKYFTFAAIDVDKGDDNGNDNHGSKIIVVPFDGVTFDAETGVCSGGSGGAGGTDGGGTGGVGGGFDAGLTDGGGAGGIGGTIDAGGAGVGGTGGTGGNTDAGSTGGVGGNTDVGIAGGGTGGSGATVDSGGIDQSIDGGANIADASGTLGPTLNNDSASNEGSGCGCRVAGRPAFSMSLVGWWILSSLVLRLRRGKRVRRNRCKRDG
jgi:hypothetical protein